MAFITGGASGIGRAIAERFYAEGAVVVVFDRQISPMSCDGDASRLHTIVGDVTDDRVVADALANTHQRFGGLDTVVSNAGVLVGTLQDTDLDSVRRSIDINLTSHINVARHAQPFLAESDGGSLTLIASEVGLQAASGIPAYVAAKGGVLSLSRALAVDLAPDGTRVNALAPGPISTPMLEQAHAATLDEPEARDRELRPVLLGRLGKPHEIAAAALFLASNDASFITGATLVVDGGVTAWTGV